VGGREAFAFAELIPVELLFRARRYFGQRFEREIVVIELEVDVVLLILQGVVQTLVFLVGQFLLHAIKEVDLHNIFIFILAFLFELLEGGLGVHNEPSFSHRGQIKPDPGRLQRIFYLRRDIRDRH